MAGLQATVIRCTALQQVPQLFRCPWRREPTCRVALNWRAFERSLRVPCISALIFDTNAPKERPKQRPVLRRAPLLLRRTQRGGLGTPQTAEHNLQTPHIAAEVAAAES